MSWLYHYQLSNNLENLAQNWELTTYFVLTSLMWEGPGLKLESKAEQQPTSRSHTNDNCQLQKNQLEVSTRVQSSRQINHLKNSLQCARREKLDLARGVVTVLNTIFYPDTNIGVWSSVIKLITRRLLPSLIQSYFFLCLFGIFIVQLDNKYITLDNIDKPNGGDAIKSLKKDKY